MAALSKGRLGAVLYWNWIIRQRFLLSLQCYCRLPNHERSRQTSLSRSRLVPLCNHQMRTYSKKTKKSQPTVELVEGESDVIDLERVNKGMTAAINALKHEYNTAVVTRITPASLDTVNVVIEGEPYPLRSIAQLGMPNPQTIIVNMAAYPKSMNAVVGAIRETKLNLNPFIDKNIIKIPIPKITGELRESLAKLAKTHAERAKVGVRKARDRGMAELKKEELISEDTVHRLKKLLQQMTDKNIATIDDLLSAKRAELTKAS